MSAQLDVALAEEREDSIKKLGIWIYLMTDCILFAALFAVFIVLRNTSGQMLAKHVFDMPPYVLAETLTLLASSFLCGLSILAMKRNKHKEAIISLGATYLLGITFLTLEVNEFIRLALTGYGWWTNGFLSAFYTLVATHGLHITIGLLWLIVIVWQLLNKGFTRGVVRRLTFFSMFWHFLDVIWIFIFTVVYLTGSIV